MRRIRIKRHLIQSEINVIPFLDVLLVLLVIFMIIPSKLMHAFEVNLPNSAAVTTNFVKKNKHIISIEIVEKGVYNFVFNDKCIKNIRLNQLSQEIIYKKNMYPELMCLIAASKTIKYNEVIQILNLLTKLGINSVGIITNPISTDKLTK